ncbi:HB22 protein, partial [Cephalopterus ornatus]|nr:HB22 protein [Cephalopterus ornatus]
AVLVVLVVLGAPPAAGEELSGVFQEIGTGECHFLSGTEQVRHVERHIFNREQHLHFDSTVGHYVGDTPYGEGVARRWNSLTEFMKRKRAEVDTFCRYNYEISKRFLVNRRGE